MTIVKDTLLTIIYSHEAGEYAVHNVLSTGDLVFRHKLDHHFC